jgi:adenosylmethionine-8-amino-7-oxononanoate aminotransferase
MARELEPCRGLPGVRDVRVLGAIGVVELEEISNPAALRQKLVARGVWVRPFRNILYLTPAFTISAAELSVLTAAIYGVLAEA